MAHNEVPVVKYDESCEYFNAHTLFHNGYHEIQSKSKMLQDAEWKYKQRNESQLSRCHCLKEERGVRFGLCSVILLLFILAIIMLITQQDAKHIAGFCVLTLLGICLSICFVIRTKEYFKEYGFSQCVCCRKIHGDPLQETMISMDEFKVDSVRSKGLYFDEIVKAVFDIAVKVDYVHNAEKELVYVEQRQRLCAFGDIVEIGYNEVSNAPDYSEYDMEDSLPSYTYNEDEHDFCSLVIKYMQQRTEENEVNEDQKDGIVMNEDTRQWVDGKLTKREYNEKLTKLKSILQCVGIHDQIALSEKPYDRVDINPVVKS